jgi:hypothetical protein
MVVRLCCFASISYSRACLNLVFSIAGKYNQPAETETVSLLFSQVSSLKTSSILLLEMKPFRHIP